MRPPTTWGRPSRSSRRPWPANFRDQLGITGGRLYECRDDEYMLVHRFGDSGVGEVGIAVSRNYKPIELTVENGVVVMDPSDPGVDPVFEEKIGARRFAAIAVGDED